MTLALRPATEADLDSISRIATAAFETGAITRHLFPSHLQHESIPRSDEIRLWRLARKTIKLQSKHSITVVAVDETLGGAVVGFSIWDISTSTKDAEQGSTTSQVPFTGLDTVAFGEMHQILERNTRQLFGPLGLRDMWRNYLFAILNSRLRKLTRPRRLGLPGC
jgi:hypothetical protein